MIKRDRNNTNTNNDSDNGTVTNNGDSDGNYNNGTANRNGRMNRDRNNSNTNGGNEDQNNDYPTGRCLWMIINLASYWKLSTTNGFCSKMSSVRNEFVVSWSLFATTIKFRQNK